MAPAVRAPDVRGGLRECKTSATTGLGCQGDPVEIANADVAHGYAHSASMGSFCVFQPPSPDTVKAFFASAVSACKQWSFAIPEFGALSTLPRAPRKCTSTNARPQRPPEPAPQVSRPDQPPKPAQTNVRPECTGIKRCANKIGRTRVEQNPGALAPEHLPAALWLGPEQALAPPARTLRRTEQPPPPAEVHDGRTLRRTEQPPPPAEVHDGRTSGGTGAPEASTAEPQAPAQKDSMLPRSDRVTVVGVGVQLTRMLLNATSGHTKTAFDAVYPLRIGICEYVKRLRRSLECSDECYVIGMIYIDRLLGLHPEIVLSRACCHNLILTSIVLAAKFHDEAHNRMEFYAVAGGTTVAELDAMEWDFFKLLGWKLQVQPKEYQVYSETLRCCGLEGLS